MKYLLCKHDWDDEKRMYNFYCFCVRTDEPVAYVPSIKGKDQNAVVRLKDFQKLVDSILNNSTEAFHYQWEKTRPRPTSTMRG